MSPRWPHFRSTLLVFLMWIALWQASLAVHPLENWQQRGPLPTSRELQDIAAGNGKLVVIFPDPAGRALVSDDGVNFAPEPLNLPAGLAATRILHANGKWLVLAGGRVWSKSHWTNAWQEGSAIPDGIAQLRALDGGFWAWSAGGYFPANLPLPNRTWRNSALYRSTDGVAWHEVPLSLGAADRIDITDMDHGGGQFVLTDGAHQNKSGIHTSPDGEIWTNQPQFAGTYFHTVTYGNGRFVAGGSGGQIAISTDAVTWTTAQFPFVLHYLTNWQPGSAFPVHAEAREVVFSNQKFVALSQGYFGYPLLAESADGVTWNAVTSDGENFARTAATRLRQIGDDTYLLGTGGNLWRTSLWQNGQTQLLPLDSWNWRAVAASATRTVIAGESGHFVWSDDANTFHSGLLPQPADVEDMIWMPDPGLFVAAGGDESTARVWISGNGTDWTSHLLTNFAGRATGVASDGHQIIVSGPCGRVAASTDGRHWTTRETGTPSSLTAIEWGGGHFVATGSGGIVLHSADGVVWTPHQLGPESVNYRGLVYGNGLWIVPDGYELHLTSNLEDWWTTPGQSFHPNLLFAFGSFIASDSRYLVSSSDGGYWQPHLDGYSPGAAYSPASGFTRGARFGDRVVFAGENGLIGTSGVWRDFFQEWRTAKFSAAELDQSAISGPDADPNGDGWATVFEYAFDLDPKTRESAGKSTASFHHADNEWYFTGPVADFSHPWAASRPGVAVWAERSRDLVTWTREGLQYDTPFRDGSGKMRQNIRLPIRTAQPEFIRLRAEISAP